MLERLVELGGPQAINNWTGWDSDRVDFRGGSVALEVKASQIRDSRTFTVHGVKQLEAPEGSGLVLILHRVERAPEGSDSVPDVIDRLRTLGVPWPELSYRLASAGWDGSQREQAALVRFDDVEIVAWTVDDAFPRIVPDTFDAGVPPGVANVSYQVTVDTFEPLETAALQERLAALAGG